MLKMRAHSKSRALKPRIEVEFRVPPPRVNKDYAPQPHSIYYYVLADDRNWVYLTSSQLDDRIAKVKVLFLTLEKWLIPNLSEPACLDNGSVV